MQPTPPSDAAQGIDALTTAARAAAQMLAVSSTNARNAALTGAAAGLRRAEQALLEANREDVAAARAAGDDAAFLDRLTLTPDRIEAMAQGVEQVVALPDPIGEPIAGWRRATGLGIAP